MDLARLITTLTPLASERSIKTFAALCNNLKPPSALTTILPRGNGREGMPLRRSKAEKRYYRAPSAFRPAHSCTSTPWDCARPLRLAVDPRSRAEPRCAHACRRSVRSRRHLRVSATSSALRQACGFSRRLPESVNLLLAHGRSQSSWPITTVNDLIWSFHFGRNRYGTNRAR